MKRFILTACVLFSACSKPSPKVETVPQEFSQAAMEFIVCSKILGSEAREVESFSNELHKLETAYLKMVATSPSSTKKYQPECLQIMELWGVVERLLNFRSKSGGKFSPEVQNTATLYDSLVAVLGNEVIIEDGTGGQKGYRIISYKNIEALNKKASIATNDLRVKLQAETEEKNRN